MWKTIWYSFVLSTYLFSYLDGMIPRFLNLDYEEFLLKFGTFTLINELNQAIYFARALHRSITGRDYHKTEIQQLFCFVGSSFGIALNFWVLYLQNPENFGLGLYEPFSKDWIINHISHTFVIVPGIIEPLINPNLNLHSVSNWFILGINCGLCVILTTYIHVVYAILGLWVYPFIGEKTFIGSYIFFLQTGLLAFVIGVIYKKIAGGKVKSS